ncbi:MAG: hypothetical protein AW08_03439 [Candidatus Accumulibacter adjunctus]|uniref:Phospholipase D-like domain-containing protein n=1 Tax=Candidatus Accumulibacter adjunctus TaxID=1454001 RepID=A0A011NKN4_9PROT|nr:MAG: hypothetical protein AW08_03439 [Candidatus Accumulibacter adjunctus]
MFLASSRDIQENIVRLMARHGVDEPIAIAVAFWGKGAEALLPADRRFRLICNLSMGGTNPAVIETLLARPGIDVRHLPDLHAKVVLTASGAVVSSANFSANGLGLDGGAGWQEAGMLIPADDPEFVKAYGWFEQLWRMAQPITETTLAEAAKQWHSEEHRLTMDSVAALEASSAPDELEEEMLFAAGPMKKDHKLREAAGWVAQAYNTMLGRPLEPSDYFIPRYAAYVIWTMAGKSMWTAIEDKPIFSTPADVLDRAKATGKDNPRLTTELVDWIARMDAAPPAVRYWAQQSMERNP